MSFQRTGILLVVSGPSGSGKTTLCRRLASEGLARYSVSCTTRKPRQGEQNGIDYHFLDRSDFTRRIGSGEFLEHAEVHGNLYGTLIAEVTPHLAQGTDVVMDIDVQGAARIRKCGDPAIRAAFADLFVMPPDSEELRLRLAARGTDDQETIRLRLDNALAEMSHWPSYSHLLVSGSREEDYARLLAVLHAEQMRTSRIREL